MSEKLANADDSLFFGLIITLVAITIPLTTDDLAKFFVPILPTINSSLYIDPVIYSLFVKTIIFVAVTISAVTRYYASIMGAIEPDKSRKWRYWSLEFMILALASVIAIGLFATATYLIPSNNPKNTGLISTAVLVFTTTSTVYASIFLLIQRLETRVLGFYSKYMVIPKNSKPIIAFALGSLCIIFSVIPLITIIWLSQFLKFSSVELIAIIISISAVIATFAISAINLVETYKIWAYTKKIALANETEDYAI